MRLTILQSDIIASDVRANLSAAESLVSENQGSDLYILPEMFATGFIERPTASDASVGAEVVEWMCDVACRFSCHVGGSVLIAERGRFFNRFVVATPDGKVVCADKRHLFSMGGEGKAYSHGDGRIIVTIGGVRLLLLVCYDLRFPVWSRVTPSASYDTIVYVANWPATRMLSWDTLLRARAIENQAYVVGVNRVGSAGNIAYVGHSVVIDPWGNDVVRCPDADVAAAVADVSADRVAEVRRKFPTLADADAFSLG